MIRKASGSAAKASRRRSRDEPLDLRLSVVLRYGDAPQDRLTMLDERRVPMVGGLIDNRDRILRGFTRLILRAASQPRLARRLFPFSPAGRGGRDPR